MLPIYTRFLTPADYGVIGLMTFAVSLIELLFGARLGLAVPKYYFDAQDDQARSSVVSTALIITSAVSAISVIIMIAFRVPLSMSLYGTSEYAAIVGFFSVMILTQGLENYALIYLRLQQRPWLYISANLFKLIVQLSLNLWLVVFLSMGVMGVAIGSMAASGFFALLLVGYTLRRVNCTFDPQLARRMMRFCWPLWIASFAALYVGSANRYFLRIFSSLDSVGLYELATKFGTVISPLVWQPFAQYWQIERFKYYRKGNTESLFRNVFIFISTLLVLASLAVAIFAPPIIKIMADEAYHRAAEAVPFLAFGTLFTCLVAFSNFSFLVKERTVYITRNNYLTAIFVTFLYLGLIPVAGHVGAAMAYLLANALHFIIVHISGKKHYDMGIKLPPLAYQLAISVVVCSVGYFFISIDTIILDIMIRLLFFLGASILISVPLLRIRSARLFLLRFFPGYQSR